MEQAARQQLQSKAMKTIQSAEVLDQNGDIEMALKLYTEGMDMLFLIMRQEDDASELRGLLRNKVLKLMQRAEALKSIYEEREKEKQIVAASEDPIQYNCEEIIHIEGVTVLGITSSSESRVIAYGALQLLSIPVPRSQLPPSYIPPSNSSDPVPFHFLQVEEFHFPLLSTLPCLRTTPIHFIFPMQQENFFVGFVLPSEIPHIYSDILEAKLGELCTIRRSFNSHSTPSPEQVPPTFHESPPIIQEQFVSTTSTSYTSSSSGAMPPRLPDRVTLIDDDPPPDLQPYQPYPSPVIAPTIVEVPDDHDPNRITPQELVQRYQEVETYTSATLIKVTQGVEVASEYIEQTIQSSSEYLSRGIGLGGEYVKSQLTPAEQEMQVNRALAATVHYGSKVSPVLVTVSGGLVDGLVAVAGALGTMVGKAIPKKLQVLSGEGESSSPSLRAAKGLGTATVRGIANIWEALDDAGKAALGEVGKEVVDVTRHKYGDQAGVVVQEGMQLTGDVIQTVYNVKSIGVKKIAKKAAKASGKKAIESYIGMESEEEEEAKERGLKSLGYL